MLEDLLIYIFLGIIAAIIVPIIVILIIIAVKKEKRRKLLVFVEQHSVARKKIIEINKRYRFFNVTSIKLKNSYDDVNFYEDITCEDYLIYKLVYDIYDKVDKSIDLVLDNRGKYKRYSEEINSLNYNLFDTDVGKYKLDVLRQVNKDACLSINQTPCIDFKVSVILTRTNYFGEYLSSKSNKFGMGELLNYMESLILFMWNWLEN